MTSNKTLKLGVNIDHVATIRQARGTDYPSVLEAAAVAADENSESSTPWSWCRVLGQVAGLTKAATPAKRCVNWVWAGHRRLPYSVN